MRRVQREIRVVSARYLGLLALVSCAGTPSVSECALTNGVAGAPPCSTLGATGGTGVTQTDGGATWTSGGTRFDMTSSLANNDCRTKIHPPAGACLVIHGDFYARFESSGACVREPSRLSCIATTEPPAIEGLVTCLRYVAPVRHDGADHCWACECPSAPGDLCEFAPKG